MNDVGREIQDMKPEYAAEGKEVLDNQRKIYNITRRIWFNKRN